MVYEFKAKLPNIPNEEMFFFNNYNTQMYLLTHFFVVFLFRLNISRSFTRSFLATAACWACLSTAQKCGPGASDGRGASGQFVRWKGAIV